MEMLVDSFISYFGYELDFKTFFWGCQKVVALSSSELLAKIFLFNFESCPFNNISVIFFFFKFYRPSCGTHLKWVAGQDFFPKFCWPSCGTYLKWVAGQDFFHKFCRPICGTHLKWVAGQDFFVQFWIMSSIQQYFSHKNFLKFFFSIFNHVFFNNIPVIKFCRPSCGTH